MDSPFTGEALAPVPARGKGKSAGASKAFDNFKLITGYFVCFNIHYCTVIDYVLLAKPPGPADDEPANEDVDMDDHLDGPLQEKKSCGGKEAKTAA